MPNIRGDQRHAFVCPDDLWDILGKHAARAGVSKGAMLRSLIRYLDINAAAPATPLRHPSTNDHDATPYPPPHATAPPAAHHPHPAW